MLFSCLTASSRIYATSHIFLTTDSAYSPLPSPSLFISSSKPHYGIFLCQPQTEHRMRRKRIFPVRLLRAGRRFLYWGKGMREKGDEDDLCHPIYLYQKFFPSNSVIDRNISLIRKYTKPCHEAGLKIILPSLQHYPTHTLCTG